MAQRKNKDRKENLLKYKKTKKMSKAPEMRPFRQVPTWQANEKFEIQGSELESLYGFFNIFAPAFTSVQQVFSRGVTEGKIKIGYEYEDGTPVGDDEVKAYTEKLNEYFQQKLKAEAVKNDITFSKSEEETGAKILDSFGSPVTSDSVNDTDLVTEEVEESA